MTDEQHVKVFMSKIASDSLKKRETKEQWLERLKQLRSDLLEELDSQMDAV